MINSNEKPKVLQNEAWLKEMWNDISISGVDLDWKIYQKNIDNYVIENDLSINLYTIFDYDEYIFNDVWYGTRWTLYKNKQPYNQNLRNLKSFKNEHGNNKSLFEYIEKMSFLKSEESIFSNRYINNDQFIKYFNNLKENNIVKSDISSGNKVKLHFTLKKLYILMYKHITKFPIDYKYDQKSLFYKNDNIYLHFNDKKFKKIPFKELKTEEKQRQWIEKLFWENEDISKHEELLLNVINFEQVSFDGITKVKKEIEGYNIMMDVLNCENKEKYFMNLYLKLMNFKIWKEEAHSEKFSWTEAFYHGNSLIWHDIQCKEERITFIEKNSLFVEVNRKNKVWKIPDYKYIDLNNNTYPISYSKEYFEQWDKKRSCPLFLLLDKNLNKIFLEKSLGRCIMKFVSYKYIKLNFNDRKEFLEKFFSINQNVIEKSEKDYVLLKRIYTFEELKKLKGKNNFLGIEDLSISKIKLKNNRSEKVKYIEITFK